VKHAELNNKTCRVSQYNRGFTRPGLLVKSKLLVEPLSCWSIRKYWPIRYCTDQYRYWWALRNRSKRRQAAASENRTSAFGGSRFTGSPSHNRSHGRHSGGPVHEENSLQGLHDRYVGLLGETFVSNSPTLFKQILIRHLDLRAFLDAAVQLGH
jgi:hypothetical protein